VQKPFCTKFCMLQDTSKVWTLPYGPEVWINWQCLRQKCRSALTQDNFADSGSEKICSAMLPITRYQNNINTPSCDGTWRCIVTKCKRYRYSLQPTSSRVVSSVGNSYGLCRSTLSTFDCLRWSPFPIRWDGEQAEHEVVRVRECTQIRGDISSSCKLYRLMCSEQVLIGLIFAEGTVTSQRYLAAPAKWSHCTDWGSRTCGHIFQHDRTCSHTANIVLNV
jgi:hypothetical protein